MNKRLKDKYINHLQLYFVGSMISITLFDSHYSQQLQLALLLLGFFLVYSFYILFKVWPFLNCYILIIECDSPGSPSLSEF